MFVASGAVAAIKDQLDHPVIDGDGHFREFRPAVADLVRDLGGAELERRLLERPMSGIRPRKRPVWGTTMDALDHMTSVLPALQSERAEELGLDFSVMYPTMGLSAMSDPDDELRPVLVRAINTYVAELFSGHRHRLEPVATVSLHDPGEAVAQLEHAVLDLGFKAIVTSGVVRRTQHPSGDAEPWFDAVGYHELHDYDPFWRRCVDLGVVPAFHGIGWGWGTRDSGNYTGDHIGSFGAAQEAACRSLIMGGVARRFPELRFVFLEGGIGWAAQLYADTLSHFAKRNRVAIQSLNPATLDIDRAGALFEQFARGRVSGMGDRWRAAAEEARRVAAPMTPDQVDDFAQSGIEREEDVVEMFRRQFFFGCEADDPMNALAYDAGILPFGIRLNAVFGSDVGHWDVPDMTTVLPEAWELVEHGHLDAGDFRDFTCDTVVRMYTEMNPAFFDGTTVADRVVGTA
jgi:predicted TIM-barrel fold metal-dependent hydrolase